MRAASVRGELGLAGMKGCRGHVSCWLLLGKDLRLKWPIFLSTSATKGQSSCPQVLEASLEAALQFSAFWGSAAFAVMRFSPWASSSPGARGF